MSLPPIVSNGPNGDENRGIDGSSVHHSLYGNHGSGRLIGSSAGGGSAGGNGGGGGVGHGNQMLIMPQPMKSLSSVTTNGTSGRKYQCKMCPQVRADLAHLMSIHSQGM